MLENQILRLLGCWRKVELPHAGEGQGRSRRQQEVAVRREGRRKALGLHGKPGGRWNARHCGKGRWQALLQPGGGKATLEVKTGSFMLGTLRNNTRNRTERLASLPMQAVHVVEVDPPAGVEPVEWMLLTNLPVENIGEALEFVRWYCLRWRIELFFKMLKSGFKILECRLGEAQRLRKYIALMSVVAWRMMMLAYLARTDPDLPCDEVLSPEKWKPLHRRTYRNKPFPQRAPTIGEAIILIAKLGGSLGRKGDGDPGMITIWRGWKRLSDLSSVMYLNANDDTCG